LAAEKDVLLFAARYFLTYGRSAMNRARFIACASFRWCLAQTPVCCGSMIFI